MSKQLSPDGKWQWNGSAWVPVGSFPHLAIVVLILIVLGIGTTYLGLVGFGVLH
jgi:hypothetical protein